VQLSTAH